MRKSKTSGSYAHHGERIGSGHFAGAGEVKSQGPGNGKTGKQVKSAPAAQPMAAAGKGNPKGLKVYKAGS